MLSYIDGTSTLNGNLREILFRYMIFKWIVVKEKFVFWEQKFTYLHTVKQFQVLLILIIQCNINKQFYLGHRH